MSYRGAGCHLGGEGELQGCEVSPGRGGLATGVPGIALEGRVSYRSARHRPGGKGELQGCSASPRRNELQGCKELIREG